MALLEDCFVLIVNPEHSYFGQIGQPTIYDQEHGVYSVSFTDGKTSAVFDGILIGENPPDGIVFENTMNFKQIRNVLKNLQASKEILKKLYLLAKDKDLPPRTREMAKQDSWQLVMKGNSMPVTKEFVDAAIA